MRKSEDQLCEVAAWIVDNGNRIATCARELQLDRVTIYRWLAQSREDAKSGDPTRSMFLIDFGGEQKWFHEAVDEAAKLHAEKIRHDDPNAAGAVGLIRRGPGPIKPPVTDRRHAFGTPTDAPEARPDDGADLIGDAPEGVSGQNAQKVLPDDAPDEVPVREVAPEPQNEPVSAPRAPRRDPLAILPTDRPDIVLLKQLAAIPPANPRATMPVMARAYPATAGNDPPEMVTGTATPTRADGPGQAEAARSRPGDDRIGAGKPPPGGISLTTGRPT